MTGDMKEGCLTLSPDDNAEGRLLVDILQAIEKGGTVTVKINDGLGRAYTTTFDGDRTRT